MISYLGGDASNQSAENAEDECSPKHLAIVWQAHTAERVRKFCLPTYGTLNDVTCTNYVTKYFSDLSVKPLVD